MFQLSIMDSLLFKTWDGYAHQDPTNLEFPNNYAFTLNGLGESEQLEVQVINFLSHHVMEEQGHFKFTFSAYSMSKQTF